MRHHESSPSHELYSKLYEVTQYFCNRRSYYKLKMLLAENVPFYSGSQIVFSVAHLENSVLPSDTRYLKTIAVCFNLLKIYNM